MSNAIRTWFPALAVSALAACAAEAPPVAHAPPAVPASAVPGQGHWLIGTWTGDRVGRRLQGPVGRMLRVTSVDVAAGTAIGRWAGQDVQITIDGNQIRFFSSGSTPVQLTYTAPGTLEGTTSVGSRRSAAPHVIVMQRQS
jgi:hypothetical protein